MNEPESFVVTLEPAGIRIRSPTAAVLEVIQRAGVHITSTCGGKGTCGKCRVLLSPSPSAGELDIKHLSPKDIDFGMRLACQHYVQNNLTVTILNDFSNMRYARESRGWEQLQRDEYEEDIYGVAIDVGTTTLACYLLDLSKGIQVSEAAVLNSQSAFGADVISRIEYACRENDGASTLRRILLKQLDDVIVRLCQMAKISANQIESLIIVGNTTMEHLLAGLDVKPLGMYPFQPTRLESIEAYGSEIGFSTVQDAKVRIAPVVSGFVGGDTVAFVLNESLHEHSGVALGIDIGTNGEVVLTKQGNLFCCSTAAGPAFEGANISQGMRAEDGAVEYVRIKDKNSAPEISVIGESPPRGLCGSGILDLVAELIRWGFVDMSGRFTDSPYLIRDQSGPERFIVSPPDISDNEHGVTFSQHDVRQVQLAKAAISAGIITLMTRTSTVMSDIQTVILAGAFGSYLRPESAIRIGLLPPVEKKRVLCVGNAAGAGAKRMLLSSNERMTAEQIARSARYVELATGDEFRDLLIRATSFDHMDLWPR